MIVENVKVGDLKPSKDQVRTTLSEEGLEQLAISLKEHGQEVPIKVRPNGKGYEIIYGHRRAEASKRAGLKTIVAIVEDADDSEALLKQILENECREDVPDIEKTRGYARIVEKLGCTQGEFASMLGVGRSKISLAFSALSAVDHGVEVYDESGGISNHHTALVSRLDGSWDEKREVADKVNSEKLSQRQMRDVVKAYNTASTTKEKKKVLQVRHPKRSDWRFEDELDVVDIVTKKRDKKRRQAEITDDPIVKNYLDAMKVYLDAIKQASASPLRFSPEAVQFIDKRHNSISKEMLTLKEVLSNV
tara:strand:+ start:345 stop:1259 length:915 start_codon:yes stop_codon:yes gene_type:complete